MEAGAIADWEADALAYQTAAEALRHPLYAGTSRCGGECARWPRAGSASAGTPWPRRPAPAMLQVTRALVLAQVGRTAVVVLAFGCLATAAVATGLSLGIMIRRPEPGSPELSPTRLPAHLT